MLLSARPITPTEVTIIINLSVNTLCLSQVDAIDYYSGLEEELTRQVMSEKGRALQSNLGMAFVTVQNEVMAGR